MLRPALPPPTASYRMLLPSISILLKLESLVYSPQIQILGLVLSHHIYYSLLSARERPESMKLSRHGRKGGTFKTWCSEWSRTLDSVYYDIREKRAERLATDTTDAFLSSFTEITLSRVMVFLFCFVVFFCFILKKIAKSKQKKKARRQKKDI